MQITTNGGYTVRNCFDPKETRPVVDGPDFMGMVIGMRKCSNDDVVVTHLRTHFKDKSPTLCEVATEIERFLALPKEPTRFEFNGYYLIKLDGRFADSPWSFSNPHNNKVFTNQDVGDVLVAAINKSGFTKLEDIKKLLVDGPIEVNGKVVKFNYGTGSDYGVSIEGNYTHEKIDRADKYGKGGDRPKEWSYMKEIKEFYRSKPEPIVADVALKLHEILTRKPATIKESFKFGDETITIEKYPNSDKLLSKETNKCGTSEIWKALLRSGIICYSETKKALEDAALLFKVSGPEMRYFNGKMLGKSKISGVITEVVNGRVLYGVDKEVSNILKDLWAAGHQLNVSWETVEEFAIGKKVTTQSGFQVLLKSGKVINLTLSLHDFNDLVSWLGNKVSEANIKCWRPWAGNSPYENSTHEIYKGKNCGYILRSLYNNEVTYFGELAAAKAASKVA